MVNILILSEKHKEEITRHVYTANEAQRDRDRENEEKDLQGRKDDYVLNDYWLKQRNGGIK